jgi:hypothetical protein
MGRFLTLTLPAPVDADKAMSEWGRGPGGPWAFVGTRTRPVHRVGRTAATRRGGGQGRISSPDRRRPPGDARERRAEPIALIGAATLAGGPLPAASRVKPNRGVATSLKERSFAGHVGT